MFKIPNLGRVTFFWSRIYSILNQEKHLWNLILQSWALHTSESTMLMKALKVMENEGKVKTISLWYWI